MTQFIGTGVALVTPFKEDRQIDFEALERLVNYQINNGIDYLVALGTTGEPATLSTSEKEEVKLRILAANMGRLPVVLGIGGNNTAAIVKEIQEANNSPFDAILSVSPYYNKPTQEGIYQHFKTMAEASEKPIIIYNVPGRTASNIAPETVLRLASDCEQIIGIKEAAGDMDQSLRLIQNKPDNFLVISGEDMMALPMALTGGAGVISVIGQGFPADFSQMISLALNGNAAEASALHYKLMSSIDYAFEEGNPAGIKSILHSLKVCEPYVRLPLVEATPKLQEKIRNFIKNY